MVEVVVVVVLMKKTKGEFVFGPKEDSEPSDAFTLEECKQLGLDPPGTRFRTAEEAKRAAERYQWQLDLKRARTRVKEMEKP